MRFGSDRSIGQPNHSFVRTDLTWIAVQVGTSAGDLQVSVGRAQRYLDIAVSLLYMSEQDCAQQNGIEKPQHCSGGTVGVGEPMGIGVARHGRLQQRVNECMYNAAVADTLNREQPEDVAQASAMGKLRQVLGRGACEAGSGLPLELEAQTLLLLGKLQSARGHTEDAVDTCDVTSLLADGRNG